MELYDLAKIILSIETSGLSKVRFAKIIYFTHKELVRGSLMDADDIRYIRMPLGPVPDGFMTLANDHNDITTRQALSGLPYNSTVYSLQKTNVFSFKKRRYPSPKVLSTLQTLSRFKTSELVEISHLEPSWIDHDNGECYYITDEDIKMQFPLKPAPHRLDSDDQLLQASLVKGMIDDIVQESTDLEYPDDAR